MPTLVLHAKLLPGLRFRDRVVARGLVAVHPETPDQEGDSMIRLRYAVIPTRDRPQDFADCVAAIAPQVDAVLVIAHEDDAWAYAYEHLRPDDWQIYYHPDGPPNISRMWNLGLDEAHYRAKGRPYDVAVLNDDVIVPPDWFDRVTEAMLLEDASAGCVRRVHDRRMTGYAFILNGDDGLRADEQFQWWAGDDDLERQASALGGVALADGPDVEHRHPNSTTVGVLAEVAREDLVRFEQKWGHRP